MITQTQRYWLTRLDHIDSLIVFLALCAVVIAIGSLFYAMNTYDGPMEAMPFFAKVVLRVILPLVCTAVALEVFVPSVKEVAAIVVVPKIVNNEKVQTIGNRLYDLAVEWMDELRPAKPEKKGE